MKWNFMANVGEYNFMVVNGNEINPVGLHSGKPTDNQMEWIKNNLRKYRNKTLIMISEPPVLFDSQGRRAIGWSKTEARTVEHWNAMYNTDLVLQGDFHYYKTLHRNGTWYMTLTSPTRPFPKWDGKNYYAGFGFVNLSNNRASSFGQVNIFAVDERYNYPSTLSIDKWYIDRVKNTYRIAID